MPKKIHKNPMNGQILRLKCQKVHNYTEMQAKIAGEKHKNGDLGQTISAAAGRVLSRGVMEI